MSLVYHAFCCINKRPDGHQLGCCASKGSDTLHAYFKARIKELGIKDTRINQSGCLGQCAHGPVIVLYPQGIWYTVMSTADIDTIIKTHIEGGLVATSLEL
jgi:(2Fe-2S) ferredoxin